MTEVERIEWLKNRQGFIGGSDIAPIMSESPYQSPWDIWKSKTEEITADEPNQQMRVGIALEPIMAQFFQEEHPDWQASFSPPTEHSKEWDFMGYNPDGLLTTPEGERVLYEAKTARVNDEWGIPPDGNIPFYYNLQVQWGMGIMELERCLVYVMLLGGFPVEYEVSFDWILFENMQDTVYEFWSKYVLPRVEPPIDHSKTKEAELKEKWPDGEGIITEAELPDDFDRWLHQWRTMKEGMRRLELEKFRLTNSFKDVIRDKDTVRINDTNVVTWKRNKDTYKTNFQAVLDAYILEQGEEAKIRINELIADHTEMWPGARPFNIRW